MNNGIQSASSQIAMVNDELRKSLPTLIKPHRFTITRRVATLPFEDKMSLIEAVRTFNDFTRDNDPYGEHDFGAIMLHSEKYFFKFDYYDNSFQYFEENGIRVLTLMHASEY